MLWQEKNDESKFVVPDDIQDLSFRMSCQELPVDHAWSLLQAVKAELPWISDEPNLGIHSIHGAASGNGWTRPDQSNQVLLQISRRTRLYLRVPKHRIEDARRLIGKQLQPGEYSIRIGDAQQKKLVPTKTVFSRSVCGMDVENEGDFTDEIVSTLQQNNVNVTKMLCGLSHTIETPSGPITARSVLLADIELEESIILQQQGLGPNRLLGCGIFLPHKSLAAVGASQDDE
ncbi:MAG: type I-MYXAN CRISPR-associated protein Cas6/Cmx6 [Gammaproteobacteria bacterium]|nr:type I-MYXAN CRISPR-associated protein Cas6/Cmx6 [Gammaproteobacteria bacterium]